MESDSEVITQTPNTGNDLGLQQTPAVSQAWGKLEPTTTYLQRVDLDKPNFLLGRAKDCDVVLSRRNFHPNGWGTVSKIHFVISHNELKEVACITDCSKNGTFVNETMVGKGKTVILQNDDEIAVGTKKQRVYIYRSIEMEKHPYLPLELRKRYVTSKLLGKGACGEVKLLLEKDTFKEYAVKKIVKTRVNIKNNLNTPERIKNEIDILKSLSHPCITSTKGIVETDEAVFIVLEYMKGGDLLDRINSSLDPLPENQVKLIFYQIVCTVQYLHKQGVTHRDLKPGNILLKSDATETLVKISDFGLSKMIHSNTLLSTICGTPFYVAPEVVDEQCKNYTQEVDIWSLGVILFHMLSNELPFNSKCNRELLCSILSGKYVMNENSWKLVSEDAKDLVTQMLVRDPNRRIKINDITNHPWIAKDEDMQRKAEILMSEGEDRDSSDGPITPTKRARLN